MAFGNGGTNDKGEPVPLQGNEQALKNELLQKDIDGFAFMEPAKVRYTCTLGESELAGETINELALVDEAGKFIQLIYRFVEQVGMGAVCCFKASRFLDVHLVSAPLINVVDFKDELDVAVFLLVCHRSDRCEFSGFIDKSKLACSCR